MPSPPIPPPELDPTRVLENFRCARAGKPIAEEYAQHLSTLTPRELSMLEEMAAEHDERDEKIRQEIAEHPDGYAWHKGPGGGLPFDWSDSELPRLRPRDWRQAEAIQFVSASSPRQQQARPQARRRGAGRPGHRRSRSTRAGPTSSEDPDLGEPPRQALALAPPPKAILTYAVLPSEQPGAGS